TLINALEYSGAEKGVALKETEVETAFSPGAVEPGQACLIPANYLKVGSLIRVTATGIVTTAASASPLTIGLKLIKPGEAATTGAWLIKSVHKSAAEAKKSATWKYETTSRIVSVGKTAKAVTQGTFTG